MEAYASHCAKGLAATLNASTYGNGSQTIVLSHGYGANSSIWHNIIPLLAICFKVLVYDLAFSPNVKTKLYDPARYSNYSAYAQDLTCILDELKVKKSIFVGHSMSAMIGGIAATQRPGLFKHLVLLNGSPRYLNDEKARYKGGFSQYQVDSIFDSIKKNYTAWVQGFAPVAIGVNNKDAILEFKRSLLRLSSQVALSTAKVVFLSDYRDVLPRVGVPTTIIQSQSDTIVPNPVAQYMQRKLGAQAKAKLRILNTTGHFLQLTDPALLVRVLKEVIINANKV
ncbi:probable strigolactone esterase d14 homolog [Phtheirospermum japonicum]|uniref:Probable strigolactone esterase d14 homolog n=1 Tax=Phtheirospermum japonicum TaxID=374723 RepID=A0A830B903_9LAMI|nr:probable strigolactone esterase d14 homolog [Phtheirospermum japonicum]